MNFNKLTKTFKIIGKKHSCEFRNYASEVPKNAQDFMDKVHEIQGHSGIEVSLFEPKKEEGHLVGVYYVGVLVSEVIEIIPSDMEYLEVENDYVTARGKMASVSDLYSQLTEWSEKQGYKTDPESFIVEIYHPTEFGEEVEVYIPVISRGEYFNENSKIVS